LARGLKAPLLVRLNAALKRRSSTVHSTGRKYPSRIRYLEDYDGRGSGHITYDDAFSTYFRVWYADWQRGLGGTFMWSLDADYDGHSQDLMDAMYNASLSAR